MSIEPASAVSQSVGRLGLAGVAALGAAFGGIGTSPLCTLETVFEYTGPIPTRRRP